MVIDRIFWPMSDEHTDETEINPEEVPKVVPPKDEGRKDGMTNDGMTG